MLWFLDWSFGSFAVIVGIIILVSLFFMLDGAEKGTLSEKKGSIIGLFLVFLMFSLCLIDKMHEVLETMNNVAEKNKLRGLK